MDVLQMALPAIKPMIKPSLKQMEHNIIQAMEEVQNQLEDGQEVILIFAVRDKKLIVAPAIVSDNNTIHVAPEQTRSIIEPQPLVPYIIKNFNQALKQQKS